MEVVVLVEITSHQLLAHLELVEVEQRDFTERLPQMGKMELPTLAVAVEAALVKLVL
jgi:hypothetical protein